MKKVVLTLLLLPIILIGAFLLYVYINSLITTEKIYYIPQVKMYIKTIDTPNDGYGYILFSQDSVFNLSKEVDYIKIYRRNGEQFLARIAVNPDKKNKLYVIPDNSILEINKVKYDITIETNELTFFNEMLRPSRLIVKKPYICIYISTFFREVFIDDNNDGYLDELFPLNNNP